MQSTSLWTAEAPKRRFFLIPEGIALPPGELVIKHGFGSLRRVAPDAARNFEVSEGFAGQWAAEQLPGALSELRQSIDAGIAALRHALDEQEIAPIASGTKINRRAAPALLALLKCMPAVIAESLSNDPSRLNSAKATMNQLGDLLADAGIAIDERFTAFPIRLSALRGEFEARRNPK